MPGPEQEQERIGFITSTAKTDRNGTDPILLVSLSYSFDRSRPILLSLLDRVQPFAPASLTPFLE